MHKMQIRSPLKPHAMSNINTKHKHRGPQLRSSVSAILWLHIYRSDVSAATEKFPPFPTYFARTIHPRSSFMVSGSLASPKWNSTSIKLYVCRLHWRCIKDTAAASCRRRSNGDAGKNAQKLALRWVCSICEGLSGLPGASRPLWLMVFEQFRIWHGFCWGHRH